MSSVQKGKINVQTENIFPIIKKFLYSEHEIFLRELIANAVDATTKLKGLASLGEVKGELGQLQIEVKLDKKKKTLTVSDRGIGMTAEEVDKYINQIAFSSAEEFISKFKGKSEAEASQLIGHFGLGFYSSFMVADKVEIHTLSYREGAEPVIWECDGSPDYTMKKGSRTERGTDIVLHINKDNEEFLEEYRVLELLRKYCRFLPVEIIFGTEKVREKVEGEKDKDGNDVYKEVEKPRIINNTRPLWTRKPVDLSDEDYKNFYRELYPYTFDEPLFWIHLNVDYPFTLTGILYFPKIRRDRVEVQKEKIQLYCNQVYVTDNVEGIVPEFLTLLHGVIDSPDIPLNVSRSYLQSDPQVKKISGHITKKVADKLEELFKNNREDFEKKWDDIKVFIQYGMISEQKFYERAEKFYLFRDIDSKYYTFEEYRRLIKENQTDKDKQLVYLYASDPEGQHTFIQAAREKGYNVLLMDGILDNHFINHIETKFDKSRFVRVDADVIDKLIPKEENTISKLSDSQKESLKKLFEELVDKVTFSIEFENLSETDLPVMITRPEYMRRMKDMSALGGSMSYMDNLPDHLNLVINANHPLVFTLAEEQDENRRKSLASQLKDLALLQQGMLKGQALTEFVKRSVNFIS
ncbi:MAG: molecular chaperone HtpG [Bacteroidales bacterium]|jgi:molecular chaperone HtpG|nr:molecular chaperone HtpG [Bacteroidales bacterium]NLH52512.1 molecular chaperone HtpG [Bacteroidales bacterium]NPV36759.1 molecular chaperone HtpG [Bacteroidales bacterium]